MKKTKLISSISLLTITATTPLALYGCSQKTTTEVHIASLCDIHGEIPGYGDDFFKQNSKYAGAIRTVQEIQKMQKDYPGSITLLCGDQNGSGTFSTCAKGKTMYPVLSAMNIPYSAVGNHAWDFGKEPLTDNTFDNLGRTKDTKGSYFVTSNVLNDSSLQTKQWIYKQDQEGFLQDYYIWKNQKVSWADSYKVIDMAGHKVALLGLTTKSTLQDGNKSEIKNLAFMDYIPAIHYTKYQMVQDMGQDEFNKIDAFVALTHVQVGTDNEGKIYGDAANLCKNIDTRIDLFLSGHWHNDTAGYVHNDILNKDIPIVQSKSHLQSFCDSKIVFDDTKPQGQRLKNIEVKIVTPEIEKEQAKASAQIQDIINNPFNDVVKNTCNVYEQQKNLAKTELNKVLGTSTNGLKYDIFDKWDQKYGETGVEQVGVFASNANAIGLTLIHQEEIEKEEIVKPNWGLTAWDSIRQAVEKGDVKLRDVYGIYAFDNKPVYFSLTYYQMEQYVRYLLAGQNTKASQTTNREHYDVPLYYAEGIPLPPEEVKDLVELPCPGQFGGIAFDVNKVDNGDGTYHFTYKDGTLKIYDPTASDDINDIDSYKPKEYWDNKLIVGVTSNFTYNDGNHEYMMIKRFAQWNDNQSTTPNKYKSRMFDEDMRRLIIETMKSLTDKGKTFDIEPDQLNKMFNGF